MLRSMLDDPDCEAHVSYCDDVTVAIVIGSSVSSEGSMSKPIRKRAAFVQVSAERAGREAKWSVAGVTLKQFEERR
jgi:hypothetical protein